MRMLHLPSLSRPLNCGFLLSFDFDETIYHQDFRRDDVDRFFKLMRQWRENFGVMWGVNTGRGPEYFQEGFNHLTEGLPHAFSPDFCVTKERHIHLPNAQGVLSPLKSWNQVCDIAHEQLFCRYGDQLRKMIDRYMIHYSDCQLQVQDDDPYSVVVDCARKMDDISDEIRRELIELSEVSIQRAGPYLRFCHREFNKGSALSQVMKELDLPTNRLAIFGDAQNDLDAMSHHPDAIWCCPVNASGEVKDKVCGHRRGYVSDFPRIQGVLDALHVVVEPYLINA